MIDRIPSAPRILSMLIPALLAVSAGAQANGAHTPFTSYEAEAGHLNGAHLVALTAPPADRFATPALEASGHSYVELRNTGEEVWWSNDTGQPISYIDVRASVPDAPQGGGIETTLNLYVNGVFRQHVNLNSHQSWIYEGQQYQASDQNPASGRPRAFFDDSHFFVQGDPIAPGSTFSFRKDGDNSASFYDLDVIDVENPPAPLAQPAGSLSITDCGAVADNAPTLGRGDTNAPDSSGAIQNCINQAQAQNRVLWVPAGTFYLKGTQGLIVNGLTIQGAGMWYSTIYRQVSLPNNAGGLGALFQVHSSTIRGLHLDSNATSRESIDGAGGAMDIAGTNWLLENLWTEHVLSGYWAAGNGGTIRNNRVTSVWADGCNLNNVSLDATQGNNLTATNNFIRGTGDDAMAINSVHYNGSGAGQVFYSPMTNIHETDNTLIAAWNGKGIGVYGGTGHDVEDNLIADTARYTGLGVGRFGVNGDDLHNSRIAGNRIERAGGNGFDQGQPAIHIGNGSDGQNTGIVDGNVVTGNVVVQPMFDGIGFSASTNTTLSNNTVVSPWRNGIVIGAPFYPAKNGNATLTANTVNGVAAGQVPYQNSEPTFSATLNGNSWQSTVVDTAFSHALAFPGTLAFASYDLGGQAIAYNVLSANGGANVSRADSVDLETSADTSGGYDLGWTASGQWFHYTVNVARPGTYQLAFRVASPGGVPRAFHLADAQGHNLSGSIDVPSTGNWQAWTTVTASVQLPAGPQVLTLNEDASGWNVHQVTASPQ